MATKTYRVAVLVEGRNERLHGPRTTSPEEAERELRVITEAQSRGTDAVVSLPWLSVRERVVEAAFIEEGWTNEGPAMPRSGPSRY